MVWARVGRTGQPVCKCDSCGKFLRTNSYVNAVGSKVFRVVNDDELGYSDLGQSMYKCRTCRETEERI